MKSEDPDRLTLPPDGRSPEDQPKWRQDFPIDRTWDHYVSRREFAKFMILTSAAFVVGQLWIAGKSLLRRREVPLGLDIGHLNDIPVGGSRTFEYPNPGNPCIMVRTGEREVVAFNQLCTHLSCPVIPDQAGKRFHCPCHNGNFDLITGRPLSGPPGRPLPRVTLEVRGDRVYAVGTEERAI